MEENEVRTKAALILKFSNLSENRHLKSESCQGIEIYHLVQN
jgi:hypothetical protein